jgi:ammonium transporter, Amt family
MRLLGGMWQKFKLSRQRHAVKLNFPIGQEMAHMIQKWMRLADRLKASFGNPVVRRNVAIYMTGKMLGLALVFVIMLTIFPHAAVSAQDTPDMETLQINAINTIWVLLATFLVFGMQVGFVMLEAGFARSRESVNILVEGIVDTCICGITFWMFGFAFMFGEGTPFIGTTGFFLEGLPATFGTTGVPMLAFWVFQYAFADTCSTITSGAMIGRCGFVGDLLYSVGVTGFIYPIIGHWAWGPGGFLAVGGFLDFAGSTVVHTIGGAISLAGAVALGPRLGRVFKRDGGGPFPPHNIILGAVGGLILWFGWYGFNPGSTLSAMDAQGIARVSFNTTLAACSAGLAALFYAYVTTKKWDLAMTVNGFLVGLVAITAPCYWVDPLGAFFIGIGGVVAMVIAIEALEYARIDDPIGAVPVHFAGGIWGTIALGLFASGKFGFTGPTGPNTDTLITGLLYGGGTSQLIPQLIGSGVTVVATLVAAFALMYAVKAIGVLRVSEAGEVEGLDLHEHGTLAYPEFIVNPNDGTPKTVADVVPLGVGVPAKAPSGGD